MRLTRGPRTALALSAVMVASACSASSPGAPPGSAQTAGSAAAAHTAQGTKATFADWPSYHGNRAHTGVSRTMPSVSGAPKLAKKLALDGAVYASPIVVGGHIITATEHDSVYAFTTSGTRLWHRKLGTPAPQSQLPCGDIFPLGVTGTPTYDKKTGLVYLVAEYGSSPRHQLVALHATTGKVAWHRVIDLPGVTRAAMQQRGALVVHGTHVYVPFGALAGDCGRYKGRLVAVQLGGSHKVGAFTVPTSRGGGLWNPAGPTLSASGRLYVTSANGAAFPGHKYDHSNSVLELHGLTRVSSFAPSAWATYNQQDLGLGSQAPALVGTKWVFIAGKSTEADVLRQGHLGGIGGQVSKTDLCSSYGGTVVDGSAVYLPCTDGVRKVHITSTGTIARDWQAGSSVTGAPVLGGGRVWALDPRGGILHEISPSTGSTTHSVDVGATSRFATPALYGRDVIVPTMAGLSIVSTS